MKDRTGTRSVIDMEKGFDIDNGVMTFDRSGYHRLACTEGQTTLDGTVWDGRRHVLIEEFRGV